MTKSGKFASTGCGIPYLAQISATASGPSTPSSGGKSNVERTCVTAFTGGFVFFSSAALIGTLTMPKTSTFAPMRTGRDASSCWSRASANAVRAEAHLRSSPVDALTVSSRRHSGNMGIGGSRLVQSDGTHMACSSEERELLDWSNGGSLRETVYWLDHLHLSSCSVQPGNCSARSKASLTGTKSLSALWTMWLHAGCSAVITNLARKMKTRSAICSAGKFGLQQQ
mmetsp:Transcript_32299/g.68778  ORF Transcript_32299/g.68778 Transcript_32299/m.68778 type:complete len:226 (-) Transcript_32299:709-1386(-)